jgi:hypothetical protein
MLTIYVDKGTRGVLPQSRTRYSSNYGDRATELLNSVLLKPDISVYPTNSGRDRRTDFSFMETHIEVKVADGDDAFVDNPGKARPGKSFERHCARQGN